MKNGPLENRSCSDILCFLVFVASMFVMVGILSNGFAAGAPEKLGYVYDSDGYPCGQKTTRDNVERDNTLFKYIYFPGPSSTTLGRFGCVKACPLFGNETSLDYSPNSEWTTGASVATVLDTDYSTKGKYWIYATTT